jgi:hypothetical protein
VKADYHARACEYDSWWLRKSDGDWFVAVRA